ncbi:hypothetical protein ACNHUS_18120 [Actinomycetes bacterium M1A6_2h]
MDIPNDGALFRRDAIARGLTDNDLRTQKRRGVIESVSRGLYLPTSALADMSRRDRHLLEVQGAVSRSSPEVVVSHQSAALLHGFEMWNPDLAIVHLSSTRARGGRKEPHRHLHADGLTPADITIVDGMRVTTAARTIADLARTESFEKAVCVGDSGLRRSLLAKQRVSDALETSSTRGRTAARRAIEFMDPRSETVGESRSRVYIHRHGLPAPELQVTLLDTYGRFLGRPDCLWEDEGVIGEFDGMVKYSKYLRPGERPGDAVAREKSREDQLRSFGWMVVRWTWADLSTRLAADRIERAMETARRMPAPTTIRRTLQ